MLQRMHCPNCGAGVHPAYGSPTVRCTYCGTTSSTQVATPTTSTAAPSFSPMVRLVYAIVGISLVGGAVTWSVKGGVVGERVVQWSASRPLLFADLDGDRSLEILGWVNIFDGKDLRAHAAIYDGATGRQLWRSPDLGTYAEVTEAQLGVADGRVLIADASGKITAYALTDAAPLWSVGLGERARDLCSAGPGQAIVVTADDKARLLALADGSFQPTTPPPTCDRGARLPAVHRASWDRTAWVDLRADAKDPEPPPVPGVQVDSHLTVAPGLQVALGYKTPGTGVPMLAVIRDGAVAWSSVVPAADPLKAAEGAPQLASADSEQVFVLYTMADSGKNPRVAAFAIDGGRRLWDEPVPEGTTGTISQVVAVDDRLLVAHWTYLRVFDRNTGALRYTIGRWR